MTEDVGGSRASALLSGEREPYTPDSDGIPAWPDPVEHEEAMEAFCKVARYWEDHGRFDDVRCRAEHPPGTIGEFISHGLGFLWHMVVMPDLD
jgi:hypothetical protein